jgi:glycosyltransferase involved in cell wall biosynthesis
MKIVFMTSGTIKSSISYRPLAFARELVKKGHDAYIFAPRFDKYSKFIDEKITNIDGVRIIRPLQVRFFNFELSLLSYIFSSLYLLLKIRPDIVHIYKPNPITITGLFVKLLGKPVIFDTDDIDSEVMKVENSSKARVLLVQISEFISAHAADTIIVASRFLYSTYKNNYKNKNVRYIPNGAEFQNSKSIKLAKHSSVRVVFIGNINRENILSPLFYAIASLKKKNIYPPVVIIGDGKYLAHFKLLSKNLGIKDQVLFIGRVPRNKLHKYVLPGDVGYSYMPNEITVKACSSMKVFQYMQYGVVPLVSNVGDLPIYVFGGKAGYIAKHSSIVALAKKIADAVSDSKSRRGKIHFILENAKRKYQWPILVQKVDHAYRSVV